MDGDRTRREAKIDQINKKLKLHTHWLDEHDRRFAAIDAQLVDFRQQIYDLRGICRDPLHHQHNIEEIESDDEE